MSPSGSLSFVRTLPVVEPFSEALPVSAVADGPGFVTFQVNVCDVVAPYGSVAVIVTEYGPVTLAELSIVPLMTPVVG